MGLAVVVDGLQVVAASGTAAIGLDAVGKVFGKRLAPFSG